MSKIRKALVVLSGGQDSTTCLFWALKNFDEVHAISFNYGQRHAIELQSATKVASLAGIATRHEIVDVQGLLQSTSPLTSDAELEKYDNYDQMERVIGDRVELTFVPMRNSLFLTIAFNRAVALGCTSIITGICQADNANYPDCTELFRHKLELGLNCSLSTDYPFIEIVAPLMNMSKAQSVDLAMHLPGCMPALAWSHTSYDGKYPPTDNNHSNVLRAKGFEEAGVPDPLVIRAWNDGLMDLPLTANYEVLRSVSNGV